MHLHCMEEVSRSETIYKVMSNSNSLNGFLKACKIVDGTEVEVVDAYKEGSGHKVKRPLYGSWILIRKHYRGRTMELQTR